MLFRWSFFFLLSTSVSEENKKKGTEAKGRGKLCLGLRFPIFFSSQRDTEALFEIYYYSFFPARSGGSRSTKQFRWNPFLLVYILLRAERRTDRHATNVPTRQTSSVFGLALLVARVDRMSGAAAATDLWVYFNDFCTSKLTTLRRQFLLYFWLNQKYVTSQGTRRKVLQIEWYLSARKW